MRGVIVIMVFCIYSYTFTQTPVEIISPDIQPELPMSTMLIPTTLGTYATSTATTPTTPSDSIPPALFSANIYDDDKDSIVIVYDQLLDESSVPATTDFNVVGSATDTNAVTSVSISDSIITLVVTSAFDTNEIVYYDYTAGTNPLKGADDGDTCVNINNYYINNNIGGLLSGLVIFDMSIAATITANDGDSVSRVTSQRGNVAINQTSDQFKPIYYEDSTALFYDNTNDRLELTPSIIVDSAFTIEMVADMGTVTSSHFLLKAIGGDDLQISSTTSARNITASVFGSSINKNLGDTTNNIHGEHVYVLTSDADSIWLYVDSVCIIREDADFTGTAEIDGLLTRTSAATTFRTISYIKLSNGVYDPSVIDSVTNNLWGYFTGNQAPTDNPVIDSASIVAGNSTGVTINYSDAEGDAEGTHLYLWQEKAPGGEWANAFGGTKRNATYTTAVGRAGQGYKLRVKVWVRANTGNSCRGEPYISNVINIL